MPSSNQHSYNHAGDILVYGSGGHALTILSAVELRGEHQVAAFVVDELSETTPESLYGVPVIALQDLSSQSSLPREFIAAIGDNVVRKEKTELMKSMGYRCVNVVHPFSTIGVGAKLGKGVFISAAGVLDAEVELGDGVIVNVKAGIGHNTKVGAYTHISGSANIGAKCIIGERCFFAMAATLISDVDVGDNVFVGAGSVVTKSVPDNMLALGSPARLRNKK
jgi:sugar O-acyltransferase (sialic acid O-acetyltransferase NeuD family)